jgi:hypothetical protein
MDLVTDVTRPGDRSEARDVITHSVGVTTEGETPSSSDVYFPQPIIHNAISIGEPP